MILLVDNRRNGYLKAHETSIRELWDVLIPESLLESMGIPMVR